MQKKFELGILLSVLILLSQIGNSQIINPTIFDKYKNSGPLPYKQKDGSFIGCGYTYECRGMEIKFDVIELDLDKHKLKLSGKIYDSRVGERHGIAGVKIFLAHPVGSKLQNIRDISIPIVINDGAAIGKKSYERYGDFKVDCNFSILDRLYFVDNLFEPIEFNIGKLLKDTIARKIMN